MPRKSDGLVGYKNPPQRSRFQPGRSGNPSGRPKRPPSLQADLALELNQTVRALVGGKQRQITKQRAMLKALVDAAVAGDLRAATVVISLRGQGRSAGSPEPGEAAASSEDKELLETFVAREVARRANETDGTPPGNDDEH